MDSESNWEDSGREKVLTFSLGSILLCGIFAFLILMCGVTTFWGIVELGGLAAFLFLNYLLWGRRFTRQTIGEREEAELREQADLDGWPLPESNQPRHL